MNQPTVSYPCPWTFTLIGTDEKAIRACVAECLAEKNDRLNTSHHSRNGKYTSLHLDTEVASEDARNRLFAKLMALPAITMIL